MPMSIKELVKQKLCAKTAVKGFSPIRVLKGNIAPSSATEGENVMNNKEFYTALMSYKASIKQASMLLEKGFISADDYSKIDTILTEKYGLSSCSIFLGNALINGEIGGNINIRGGEY